MTNTRTLSEVEASKTKDVICLKIKDNVSLVTTLQRGDAGIK